MIYGTLLFLSGAGANDITSAPIDLGDCGVFDIQAVFTGSDVAGTFKLQRSVDGTNFKDIAGATVSVSSSATAILGNFDETNNPTFCSYRYVRAAWSHTSGTGNMTVTYIVKQNPVYN